MHYTARVVSPVALHTFWKILSESHLFMFSYTVMLEPRQKSESISNTGLDRPAWLAGLGGRI